MNGVAFNVILGLAVAGLLGLVIYGANSAVKDYEHPSIEAPGCCIEVDEARQLIRVNGADCGKWAIVLVGCRP